MHKEWGREEMINGLGENGPRCQQQVRERLGKMRRNYLKLEEAIPEKNVKVTARNLLEVAQNKVSMMCNFSGVTQKSVSTWGLLCRPMGTSLTESMIRRWHRCTFCISEVGRRKCQ